MEGAPWTHARRRGSATSCTRAPRLLDHTTLPATTSPSRNQRSSMGTMGASGVCPSTAFFDVRPPNAGRSRFALLADAPPVALAPASSRAAAAPAGASLCSGASSAVAGDGLSEAESSFGASTDSGSASLLLAVLLLPRSLAHVNEDGAARAQNTCSSRCHRGVTSEALGICHPTNLDMAWCPGEGGGASHAVNYLVSADDRFAAACCTEEAGGTLVSFGTRASVRLPCRQQHATRSS